MNGSFNYDDLPDENKTKAPELPPGRIVTYVYEGLKPRKAGGYVGSDSAGDDNKEGSSFVAGVCVTYVFDQQGHCVRKSE